MFLLVIVLFTLSGSVQALTNLQAKIISRTVAGTGLCITSLALADATQQRSMRRDYYAQAIYVGCLSAMVWFVSRDIALDYTPENRLKAVVNNMKSYYEPYMPQRFLGRSKTYKSCNSLVAECSGLTSEEVADKFNIAFDTRGTFWLRVFMGTQTFTSPIEFQLPEKYSLLKAHSYLLHKVELFKEQQEELSKALRDVRKQPELVEEIKEKQKKLDRAVAEGQNVVDLLKSSRRFQVQEASCRRFQTQLEREELERSHSLRDNRSGLQDKGWWNDLSQKEFEERLQKVRSDSNSIAAKKEAS